MIMELVALPKSSDPNSWSPEERALVEAAGLVHTDAQSGAKTLAERPVVAAFLQHCARTGLDPIARQIYSIARKSKGQLKWQIQISIDGARLVAERSGRYEGQTTPEFTGDGETWTQVWLRKEPPAAARVGVYRAGFREPLYAVALWDAYVQTNYKGEVTEMWRKMGPLMLAKCAEMLALRKAFPQDLSGLYSAEEMSQAERPQEARGGAQRAAAVIAGDPGPGKTVVEDGGHTVVVDVPVDEQAMSKWLELKDAIDGAPDKDALKVLWGQAKGLLNSPIPGDASGKRVGDYFMQVAATLPDAVEEPDADPATGEVLDDPAPVAAPETGGAEWPVVEIPGNEAAEEVTDEPF